MKFLSVLIGLLYLFSAQADPQKSYYQGQSIKMLSLNTWMIPFLGKKAKTRAKLIGRELQAYDMAFMQEVFLGKDRRRITKYLNKGEHKYHSRFEGGALLKLSPGLFNVSRFPVVESSFMKFKDCLDEQCHAKKGVLHTRIKIADDLEIDVYNGHFQPFKSGDNIRARQMEQTVKFLKVTNNKKRPAILVGDLNTSNAEAEMMRVLKDDGFRDAWTQARGTEPGYTWDSNINLWSRRIDRTHFGQHRLDYIFVRGTEKINVEVESADIVFDKPLSLNPKKDSMFISDHFGVETNIRFLK